MDREAIKRELREQMEQGLDEAMDAVERAPDGRWIAGSEWQVRAVFQRLMRQSFEKLLRRTERVGSHFGRVGRADRHDAENARESPIITY